MMNPAILQSTVHKVRKHNSTSNIESVEDVLAIEEPFEISISVPSQNILSKNISITMRTPGQDADLALGFLFTEGIIQSNSQVEKWTITENKIDVVLNDNLPIDLSKIERHFYTTSSCGVCGKASIDAIRTVCPIRASKPSVRVSSEIIHDLPNRLRSAQPVFDQTGGLHAAALFDLDGQLLALREDVGRHNALDKLIGHALQNKWLPLNQHVLLLSGRTSFELIQKSAMAELQMVLAVGAPSSLAVELANEFNLSLIGFLNADRFNIYAGKDRVTI